MKLLSNFSAGNKLGRSDRMRKQAFLDTEPIPVGESMQMIATSIYRLIQEAFGKRDADIFWDYDNGKKAQQIAKAHGLTSNRVRQIIVCVSKFVDECFSEKRLRSLTIVLNLQTNREQAEHILLSAGYYLDITGGDIRESEKELDLEQKPVKTELDVLNLNTRTRTALVNRRITTVEELCSMTRRDLHVTRGIGPLLMKHIEHQMEAHNLHFSG